MRVGLIALLQESNTFAPRPTSLEDFQDDLLLTGSDISKELADSHHEVGGFLSGLQESGIEVAPLMVARAVPSGVMTQETLTSLENILTEQLRQAEPLDGVLVAPHGATVSQSILDVDGHWLSLVRHHVGPETLICGTLDLHANLSLAMVQATNALVAYQTNPHLDQRDRGRDAALLLARAIRGDVRPTQAACLLPLAIPIEAQLTSEAPCSEVFAIINELISNSRVLAASILLGFPYADVPEMGTSTLVVTDGDLRLADQLANELAEAIWRRREHFTRGPVSIEQAMSQVRIATGPVCLLDIGDNIGGGAPGDATHLAHALLESGVSPALVCLCDPEAVAIAEAAGTGRTIHCEVGGKSCPEAGKPIGGPFEVVELSSGRFSETQATHGGFTKFDQGQTAVLRNSLGLTIVVTSRRTPPFSLLQLTSAGVEPGDFLAIGAKGVHAPVAAYRQVCQTFIRVDTPGVTTADMTKLSYRERRKPLYPFELNCQWTRADSTA